MRITKVTMTASMYSLLYRSLKPAVERERGTDNRFVLRINSCVRIAGIKVMTRSIHPISFRSVKFYFYTVSITLSYPYPSQLNFGDSNS